MKNLKFKRLLVLSNSTKSAGQFEFKPKINLITANDNSVGKSSIVKLLLWGVGCDPAFDTKWNALDCQTLVEFEINGVKTIVQRYKNSIVLKDGDNEAISFEKITGDYAEQFAKIVGFKALLKSRGGKIETPPPAYYFLPFYIDQRRSWGRAWDNFENLGQYEYWKTTIIEYHIGLLTPRFFEIEKDKSIKTESKKVLADAIDKIDTALEIVDDFIPVKSNNPISVNQLDRITKEISVDLKELELSQETSLEDYTVLQSEKVYLEQQETISQKIIHELDKDYTFSVENIEDEIIKCPLCGQHHENSVIARSSIMTDKTQAINQLESIENSLLKVTLKIQKTEVELSEIKKKIVKINEKYIVNGADDRINLVTSIESIAGNSIVSNILLSRDNKVIEKETEETAIKGLSKEQREIKTKELKENCNANFISILKRNIKTLDAEAVNLSEINSPSDYNKIVKEGGAAEGVRAILAYYITIFKMVESSGNETLAPLIIDTPNQQEQSHTNYNKIVELIADEIDDSNQLFLCAMENEHLKPILSKAHIISLGDGKLLKKELYDQSKSIIDSFLE